MIRLTSFPSFSYAGDKIIYDYRSSLQDNKVDIYTMNIDGTNKTRLTNNSGQNYFGVFSPDDSKIVFTSDRDGNQEIYIMNADGTNQTRLTNNSADDNTPSF